MMNIFVRQNDNELFKYLTADEIAKINTIKENVIIQSQDYVIQEKDISRDIFIIHKGHVSVYYIDSNGNEKEIASLYEGEAIGEINFILPVGRTAYIKAAKKVELFCYPYQDLIELLKNDMTLAAKIFASLNDMLAKRIVRTTQKMEGNV